VPARRAQEPSLMATNSGPPLPGPGPHPLWAQVARIVLDAQPLTPTLQQIAEIALQSIPELVDVSITLIEDARPRTVVFTGPLAVELDERQYTDGQGPCTDAAFTGATIVVDATSGPSSYPGFARAAARRGITNTLSVGMAIPQPNTAALNMYSGADHPISKNSIAAAEEFASYAAVAITNAALYHAATDTALQMNAALQSRATIEQAKGVIMGRQHCTADEAFHALSRTSQNRNQKLHAVAGAIVASTTSRPPRATGSDTNTAAVSSVADRDAPATPPLLDSVVLAHAEQIASLGRLTAAMDADQIVGPAIGIVMERLQLDRAAAFSHLSRRAQGANDKLISIAHDIVFNVERNATTN
jgi:AmiR/NasT family two-component response regulator